MPDMPLPSNPRRPQPRPTARIRTQQEYINWVTSNVQTSTFVAPNQFYHAEWSGDLVNVPFEQEHVNLAPSREEMIEMESNQERIEASLRHLFKHKILPEHDGQSPIKLFEAIGIGYFVWNDVYGSRLAYIDYKHKLIAVKRETVYLRLFQDFASQHGYKINQPPNMPNMVRYNQVVEAPNLYETPQESPMTT